MGLLQRNLAKPVTKKQPVTAEMLNIIVDNAEESGSLTDCWLATVCVVSYAAFLRFDKLVHIKAVDITFYGDHMPWKQDRPILERRAGGGGQDWFQAVPSGLTGEVHGTNRHST